MQFIRATRLTAVLGFALALSLHAQRSAARSGPPSPAHTTGSSVPSAHFAPASGLGLGGQPYPIRRDIPTPLGLNAPASAYTGILPGALNSSNGTRGSRNYSAGQRETTSHHEGTNGRRGSRYYPGFVASPLYLPTYVDPFFSSFGGYDNPEPPPVDPNAQALAESQNALAQQVEQLAAQVQEMKNSNAQQLPAPAPMPSASTAPEHRPSTPPVTLVLRDGQKLSVESYAVMNQMFWNFSRRPVQKIPIANIDIPASTRATEENGGEFPQLTSPQ